MTDIFTFELVSPEKILFSAKVISVVLPGSEGEITVMVNHAPVMSTVKPGIVTIETSEGISKKYIVYGGFVDILPTSCTLLAEAAIEMSAVETNDIDERITAANEAMRNTVNDADKTRLSTFVSQLEELKSEI